jgi:hypothetical protein
MMLTPTLPITGRRPLILPRQFTGLRRPGALGRSWWFEPGMICLLLFGLQPINQTSRWRLPIFLPFNLSALLLPDAVRSK